uniref:C2H2-type domain-containing protein n=1 Tax=Oncorhynchus tshawytscha TaxID=74940 RepID=A0A8C8C4J2_ONCTS
MHTRRLVKRSILGSRVYAPSPTGDGAPLTGLVQAVKQENRDVSTGPRRNVYTVLMQDGSLKEFSEDEIAVGFNQTTAKGPLKSSLKEVRGGSGHGQGDSCHGSDQPVQQSTGQEPPSQSQRGSEWLVEGEWWGLHPSSYSSSGYWSWSGPSDQSNPSTPSPPLSADSFKPFRMSSVNGPPPDDAIDEQDGSSLLFDEPIPRKRKNSMKVMFKCLWKNCGKVLSTAAGIQRHIRTVHLGRNCDSDCSDGEEDFYYSEIKLNTDSVADGLSSLSPVSPSVLSPISPPHDHHRRPPAEGSNGTNGNKDNHSHTHSNSTPLSRSAPSALYLIHAEHAYQATAPVTIPFSGSAASGSAASTSFTPSSSSTFSISWQSPPVTFTGTAASPTHSRTQSFGEQRSQTIAVLSSPPRATGSLSRKSRGEGKKCRKVYGMENRDMWCTACRWKKACQRFTD